MKFFPSFFSCLKSLNILTFIHELSWHQALVGISLSTYLLFQLVSFEPTTQNIATNSLNLSEIKLINTVRCCLCCFTNLLLASQFF